MTIHGTAYFGAAVRCLGVLASTAARFDEAEGHFEAALRRHQVLGARPWVARTEVDYAAMRLRRANPGDGAAARELLDSAIAASEEIGASAITDRARRLIDQLNTRPLPSWRESRAATRRLFAATRKRGSSPSRGARVC